MNKIPVLKTISYAYSFTFGQLGTVIGLIWIPLVILGIGTYFTWAHYLNSLLSAAQTGNLANAGGAALLLLGWTITGLLVQSVAFVGVTQQALGLRKGPAVARFSVGPPEFRIFGGLLSLAALLLLFAIIVNASGFLVSMASAPLVHSTPIANAIGAVAKLVLDCAMVFIVVRLGFLLVPSGVAENRVTLTRSWALTSGNFWRIVGVSAAVLVPVLLLAGVAEWAVLGPKAFVTAPPGQGTAGGAADMTVVIQQLSLISAHLPELVGLSLLVAPFCLGLLLSAQSFAYRSLIPVTNCATQTGP